MKRNRLLDSSRASDSYDVIHHLEYELLRKYLVSFGKDPDLYEVLKPTPKSKFPVVEARKSNWVEFYNNAMNLGVSPDNLPNIEECDQDWLKITLTDVPIRSGSSSTPSRSLNSSSSSSSSSSFIGEQM